jgi:hemerythrin-like domain-containing protein
MRIDRGQIRTRAEGDNPRMGALIPSPAAGFDHPIDILGGCHERIRRNCVTIERLAAHLAIHGTDAEARHAAAGVVRYFETAAANHHRDEEEDLFPALQYHVPSSELNAVFSLVKRLRADHARLDALWSAIRARLVAVIEGRESGLTPEQALDFRLAYDRHIALEEAELLPLARRVLGAGVIARLGGAMARRRGVIFHAARG